MRKLVVISALLCLFSASAQASEHIRGLVLASSDTPAAASTDTTATNNVPRPLPPKGDAKSDSGKKSDTDKPLASAPADQPSGPKPQAQPRRNEDSDEAKARRIAAKYGIRW